MVPASDADRRPTVLVASTPITAHALNATPVVRSLRAAGARVLWYAAPWLRAHAERWVGEDFVAFAADLPTTFVPASTVPGTVGSLAEVRRLYRDYLVGSVPRHVDALLALVKGEQVDVVVSDTLMLAAGIVSELTGVAWATLGDGPLQWPDPDLPPFGSGLPVLHGPAGRHRNRQVKHTVDAVLFSGALADYNQVRRAHGLWPVSDLLTAGVSRRLHLQGCTPGFEYPRKVWPEFIRFVGALGPGPGFAPPVPAQLLRDRRSRPLALVTQGTMRPDPRELALPASRALLSAGFEVLVAGMASPLPGSSHVTAVAAVDYYDALAQADVFVTNGGYTGVTLALAAGTPVVQCGATEEKPDIGARLRASGAGEAIRMVKAPPWVIERAVRRVLTDPGHRRAQERLRAEFAAHDAEALIRDALLPLLPVGTVRSDVALHEVHEVTPPSPDGA